MKIAISLLSCFFVFTCLNAQDSTAIKKENAYTKTIETRAEKIVVTLGITDLQKSATVKEVITNQYRSLNDVYTKRDEEKNKLKLQTSVSKEIKDSILKQIDANVMQQTQRLHGQFIEQLTAILTTEQIVKVKEGMTFGVATITYNAYLDMIPSLTNDQKAQIKVWLEEAREFAMDAESADKKHAWFGKYKGRINNYLSAAGYNITKERDEWQKRIKERDAAKKQDSGK